MSTQKNGVANTRQSTGRYRVNFIAASGHEEQILVLCDPESTIANLRDEVGRRLNRAGIPVAATQLRLRLDSRTGPLLSEDDPVGLVLPDQTAEVVFALEAGVANSAVVPPKNQTGESENPPAARETRGTQRNHQDADIVAEGAGGSIKVRVVTPHLARLHKNTKEVSVMPVTFSPQTTLRRLYEGVAQHLSLPTVVEPDRDKLHHECNCSLARAIHQGTLFRTPPQTPAANRILVIHSRNVVEPMDCAHTGEDAVIRAVRAHYSARSGSHVDGKNLRFFAAVPSAGGDTLLPLSSQVQSQDGEGAPRPLMTPAIVTICSAKRHRRYEIADDQNADPASPTTAAVLDLHTAECPILTQDVDLTLEELCLTELAIDGVLTIYAVPRQFSSAPAGALSSKRGQDAIYVNGAHWELPTKQTERGMAMFLSSLRMAVHLISRYEKAGRAEEYHDSALHLLHVLTRFPPAVRALHILLEGSVAAEEECAALIHACYEVMVDMMATSVLARNRENTLEGSRLFFSTLLAKAEELAVRDDPSGSILPYVCSMKSVNLTNSETMEPIASPVDTNVGMMEQGCFDALKAGIIRFPEGELNQSLNQTVLDGRTKRAVILGGGTLLTNTMFDMEIAYSSGRYTDNFDEAKIFPAGELTNILQHAANAFKAKLQVVAPASLGSAPNPVLTLDRDGFLAVYRGRRPCGDPGRDFIIFRPTKGGECEIDISIVAQLLEPIIATRVADGTAIFDGEFYAAQRRSDKPDEILMICVDCSSSMSESAGFVDTTTSHDDDEDDGGRSEADGLLAEIRENEIYIGSLEDMKETLQAHESFGDMVHTVRTGRQGTERSLSSQLIKRVIELNITKLMHKMEKLEGVRQRVWRDRTGEGRQLEDTINILRNQIAGFLAHEAALSEFLIYRGCGITESGQPNGWRWSSGDAIPALPSNGPGTPQFASTSLGLTVPHDLRCPMTQELFREPASTQDGHTYETAAIRKWLRIAETSPLTGLRLSSTQLTIDRPMLLRANTWAEGAEVLPATPSRRPFARRSVTLVRVHFVSPLAQFTRLVPPATSKSALYELAFRGLRGQYPNFSLVHDGLIFRPGAERLSILIPTDGFRITIRLPETGHAQTASGDGSDLCLVKVYRSHGSAAFSYWVRRDTKATVGSVLFKTFRHVREVGTFPSGNAWTGIDVVWHSLRYTGDGKMNGTATRHWEQLSGLLKAQYATGVLGPEPLYAKPIHDGSGGSSGGTEENTTSSPKSQGPMVLKLYVCGPSRKGKDRAYSSRLSILKQMFDQFVNRILAYGYSTHLGLIKFDNTAQVAQRLSPVIENFRNTVQELKHTGDTALWNALALARDQIQEYSAAYPDAKKRILCISDGVDTSSKTNTGSNLWKHLADDEIVVDSFCLGQDENSDLRTVSYLTNGYKFHPRSLEQAMAICEMEPVLSQLERPLAEISASRQNTPRPWPRAGERFRHARSSATAEVVTQDIFPKRIEHPSLKDDFVELKAVPRRLLAETRNPTNTTTGTTTSTTTGTTPAAAAAVYLRTHRILTEIQRIVADPHPHADVYVSERDMSFWKVVLQGPPGSVYAGGTFVVYLHMEEDSYPSFAPKARFVTPIYHPNVNRHGRICHSILDRNWTVDTTNAMVIATVYGLLMEPDYSDPVNIVVTLDFHHDQVAFAEMAREFIQRHATKTRAQWRAEILGSQIGHADAAPDVART
ncbi:uncharacterized protein B0H64DRAFT_409684 [Chaetomium fimeti]|uniref:peptidylprolyl isomerase n=1 Tax=Chaetomium fimeti TaxID=1854472 RepID=A0AAE0H7Z4_9PEZI|nr:hypothetical protein B0H64DRAFT_409684 [Chaetomium fimeti]